MLNRSHWLLILLVLDDKLKIETINCDFVFSREILHRSSNERLRKEESRKPKYFRLAKLDPFLKELNPFIKLQNPSIERLLTEKPSGILPRPGNLIEFDRAEQILDLSRHNLESFDWFLEIDQLTLDDFQQSIIPNNFLYKNSIHRLYIVSRIGLPYLGIVEHLRDFTLQ